MNARAAVWAFVVYALLPVLRNTMVGLDNVDRAVIEAGRGMGMTRLQVLTRIELPLAVPVILAGVRVAMVLNIGMATLAFLIGGGALGVTIYSGIELNQNSVLIVGAVLVAIVALTFDWLGAVAERYLRPAASDSRTASTPTPTQWTTPARDGVSWRVLSTVCCRQRPPRPMRPGVSQRDRSTGGRTPRRPSRPCRRRRPRR